MFNHLRVAHALANNRVLTRLILGEFPLEMTNSSNTYRLGISFSSNLSSLDNLLAVTTTFADPCEPAA